VAEEELTGGAREFFLFCRKSLAAKVLLHSPETARQHMQGITETAGWAKLE
jgi:hypothetical protein